MAKINAKKKGSGFELKVSKMLGEWWGEEFHRTPGSGGLQWHRDNRVSGDIVAPEGSDFPYSVECKKVEGFSLEQFLKGGGLYNSWWIQCATDAEKVDKKPLLIFSKNFDEVYGSMLFDDFKNIHPKRLRRVRFFVHNNPDREDTKVIFILKDFLDVVDKDEILRAYFVFNKNNQN